MKRIGAIVTALVLCFIFCGASAESFETQNFNIRNGITFTSTMEDVKKVEGSNSHVELFYTSDGYLSYKGSVAGYDGSQVFYKFVKGKIACVYYRLGSASTGDKAYAETKRELISKYGKPAIEDAIRQYPLFLHEVGEEYNPFSVYNLNTQWLVKYSDCYSVITLWTENGLFGGTVCYLRYDLYSHSEMELLLAEKTMEMEEAENQKNSDF